jgi:hypothetical protein
VRERALNAGPVLLAVITSLLLAACGGSSRTTTDRLSAEGSVPLQPHELTSVSFQHVFGPPFGVVTTPDGRYAFVDLVEGRVLVYSSPNGSRV